MKISVGIGNFYYFNYSLLECLNYINDIENISGIEIVVKHEYKFSKEEIDKLKEYKYNTLHLMGFKKDDIKWMKYCVKTIPNFIHFVLHPDNAELDNIPKELKQYISFENMDKRKKTHQTPIEMKKLFNDFTKSKFTFDINHAEENEINYSDFNILQYPQQIHFSVVNKDYYLDNPEIDTPHSLACLEEGFNFDLKKYKNSIITLEGVFIPGRKDLIKKEITLVSQLLK